MNAEKLPPKPTPPLHRLIQIDEVLFGHGWCKLCHSTMARKHLLFGKITCVNPQCESNRRC